MRYTTIFSAGWFALGVGWTLMFTGHSILGIVAFLVNLALMVWAGRKS